MSIRHKTSPPKRRWAGCSTTRLIGVFCALLVLATPGGCKSSLVFEDGARLDVVPRSQQVDAIAGRTLVVPVDVRVLATRDAPAMVTNIVPMPLGPDTILTGMVYRIRIAPGVESPLVTWVPTQPWWDVRAGGTIPVQEVGARYAPGAEFWVIAVELPTDAHGQTLRIGENTLNTRWHESWKVPQKALLSVASSRDQSRVVRLLRPIASSPLSRWRVWLLHDRKPAGVPTLAGLLGASLGHPVLDALDRQVADRWRLALRTLDEDDPALSERVRESLTRLVSFDREPVPAWEDDSDATSALLDALLRATSSTQRASLAEDWLDRQRGIAVWMVDDAARVEQGDLGFVLGVAELQGQTRSVTLRNNEGENVSSFTLDAHSVTLLEIAQQPGTALTVQTEPVSVALGARLNPRAVAPPGARVGPFLVPWTMPTWLAQEAAREPDDWASAGLLYREALADTWMLYLECRVPLDYFAGPTSEDVVRVWCGDRGEPSAVLRVSSLGTVFDELTGTELLQGVVIRRERDRWTALFALPESFLSREDALLLGFERLHAGGGRSSWPRPVFPWQIEPGRAAFLLDAWDSQ